MEKCLCDDCLCDELYNYAPRALLTCQLGPMENLKELALLEFKANI